MFAKLRTTPANKHHTKPQSAETHKNEDKLSGGMDFGNFRYSPSPLQRFSASSAMDMPAAYHHHTHTQAADAPAGLPDKIKSGIENLSGIAMDEVRVHYNSSQPAQMQALAYAQGRDIHLAPGQERHLPHEAWHLVQQAQGRVTATRQLKGGVVVNDDEGLEHEADIMGNKVASGMTTQLHTAIQRQAMTQSAPIVQRMKFIQGGGTSASDEDQLVPASVRSNFQLIQSVFAQLPQPVQDWLEQIMESQESSAAAMAMLQLPPSVIKHVLTGLMFIPKDTMLPRDLRGMGQLFQSLSAATYTLSAPRPALTYRGALGSGSAMALERGAEHIGMSCYAASILNLLAATPGYRAACNPAENPLPEDSPGGVLQQAIHPLLNIIANNDTVPAGRMAALIELFEQRNILDLRQGEEALYTQQDASQVLMRLLPHLVPNADRLRTSETRTYDNGDAPLTQNEMHDVLQINAHGHQSLEQALLAEFADAHVNSADAHTVRRRIQSFPPTLSIGVTRAARSDALDMPAEFTVPAEVVGDDVARPRYRLQALIARNTFSHLSGGHYVAVLRGAEQHWYEANDIGQAKADQPGVYTPQTRQVDLATHTVGGDQGPAWTMATLYTYVRIDDGQVDAPRVTIGSLPPAIQDQQNFDLATPGAIPEYKMADLEVLETFSSGSTKPMKVRMPDGKLKVLKFGKDEGHLLTEILSNKLYQAAGIGTLKVDLIRVDGKLAQITDFIEKFKKPEAVELMQSGDFSRHVGADMVFANWDLFKTDNWMEINGRMVRSDNGGALDRRAQGDPKSAEEWSGRIGEFASMRKKKDSPYSRLTDKEIADSIRTLAFNLTPERIAKAMAAASFPKEQQAKMMQTLLQRIDFAIAYAESIYPMAQTVTVDHSWQKRAPRVEAESDDAPLDVIEELARLGWTNLPINPLNPGDGRYLFQQQASDDPHHIMSFLPNSRIFTPPEVNGRTGNPYELLPMVGPEELLNEDQFGGGIRASFAHNLPRMRTGRLTRRMSDGEKAAFEKAARAKDIETIVELIFPTGKNPGARGEMVLSVNDPFIFEREKAALKGEAYTGKEKKHDPKDYHWIMEMPISDDMLEFLINYSHVQAPHKGSKPQAFLGNPNLKMEGQAGGRGGEDGIPNVVLKREGFAHFWRTVRQFSFIEAEDHMWKSRSNNADLQQALLEKARKELQDKKRKEREEAAKNKKTDDIDDLFGGGDIFGFNSGDDDN